MIVRLKTNRTSCIVKLEDSVYYWLKQDMRLPIDDQIEMEGDLPFVRGRNIFLIVAKKISGEDDKIPVPVDGQWTNCTSKNIKWVCREVKEKPVKEKRKVIPNVSRYGGKPRFSAGRGTSIYFDTMPEAIAVAALMRKEGLVGR